jgi:signal transduction histidine kinase
MQAEEILRRGQPGGEVTVPRTAVERIRASAARLSQMIDDLLDASRIELGRLPIKPRPIALAAAVSSVVERLGPQLAGHAVEIRAPGHAEASLPRVMADPLRIDQVLTNLLDNAVKYAPKGTRILVEVRGARGGVEVAVKDEGPGIPREELTHLFDRFFQCREGGRRGGGLGLGLYITRGLVEAHGGTVTVESELGRGSTFRVWLPAV